MQLEWQPPQVPVHIRNSSLLLIRHTVFRLFPQNISLPFPFLLCLISSLSLLSVCLCLFLSSESVCLSVFLSLSPFLSPLSFCLCLCLSLAVILSLPLPPPSLLLLHLPTFYFSFSPPFIPSSLYPSLLPFYPSISPFLYPSISPSI